MERVKDLMVSPNSVIAQPSHVFYPRLEHASHRWRLLSEPPIYEISVALSVPVEPPPFDRTE